MSNKQKSSVLNPVRKLVVLMGMTVDGRAAEGWIPYVKDENLLAEVYADMWKQLKDIDTFIFGRINYELWERVWPPLANDPSASVMEREFSAFVEKIPKVVISRTLKSASWQNSTLLTGEISDYVEKMKQKPGKNIAIVGGPGIAQSLTKLGLVDEYILWIHPLIKGSGKSLFPDLNETQQLKLVEMKVFKSGLSRAKYQTVR